MSHPMPDDVVTAALSLCRTSMRHARRARPRAVCHRHSRRPWCCWPVPDVLPALHGRPRTPPVDGVPRHRRSLEGRWVGGVVCMIATVFSAFAGWLPAEVGRALCGQPPDLRVAGSLRPQGQASPVEGGYRVRGRWNFASGITHANWLHCSCVVMEGATPRLTPAGTPETRALWVPAEAAAIEDTWSVVGMCGTGSQDFRLDEVFVPTAHTFSLGAPPQESGPLYHPRLLLVTLWTSTVANALGMARGAMDSFIALATCISSTASPTPLRERSFVQTRVAEAEAILSAARAYVVDAVGTAWEAVCVARQIPAGRLPRPGWPLRTACMKPCGRSIGCFTRQARMLSIAPIRWSVTCGICTWPCSIMRRSPPILNRRARCSWVYKAIAAVLTVDGAHGASAVSVAPAHLAAPSQDGIGGLCKRSPPYKQNPPNLGLQATPQRPLLRRFRFQPRLSAQRYAQNAEILLRQ